MRNKLTGSTIFFGLGLIFIAFGVFGLVNLHNIGKVGDTYVGLGDSPWAWLIVVFFGAFFCYCGFAIWRRSK